MFILLISLLPVTLLATYSEIHNYVPSIAVIAMFTFLLTSTSYKVSPTFVSKYGSIILVVLTVSFVMGTFARTIWLFDVSRQTSHLLAEIKQAVPGPESGDGFVLQDRVSVTNGYSLYGLRGVGVLESFGVAPALQLIYDLPDLKAVLLSSSGEPGDICRQSASAVQLIHVVTWDGQKIDLNSLHCEDVQD
jgi:hypothetical protein